MPRKKLPVPEGVDTLSTADVRSPIGTFRVGYDGKRVAYVDLMEHGIERSGPSEVDEVQRSRFPHGSPPEQLQEYFQGKRHEFAVELAFLGGSGIDRKVWYGLHQIPFGNFRTYGEVARRIGQPRAARAVGGAAHRNPIPIIVPCHRLVGQDRSLTGFGLGLWRKRWLLKHEGIYPLPPPARSSDSDRGRQATLEESLRQPKARG
ncbi:MAG: methylated-DNA--[protein]-cysteine S-methyltransferase [Euryarchaeota archaeon]|nr:methylated-DNA--[protein]-cysteine S-methyltransferase [Euryarchaeota archaeon]